MLGMVHTSILMRFFECGVVVTGAVLLGKGRVSYCRPSLRRMSGNGAILEGGVSQEPRRARLRDLVAFGRFDSIRKGSFGSEMVSLLVERITTISSDMPRKVVMVGTGGPQSPCLIRLQIYLPSCLS